MISLNFMRENKLKIREETLETSQETKNTKRRAWGGRGASIKVVPLLMNKKIKLQRLDCHFGILIVPKSPRDYPLEYKAQL